MCRRASAPTCYIIALAPSCFTCLDATLYSPQPNYIALDRSFLHDSCLISHRDLRDAHHRHRFTGHASRQDGNLNTCQYITMSEFIFVAYDWEIIGIAHRFHLVLLPASVPTSAWTTKLHEGPKEANNTVQLPLNKLGGFKYQAYIRNPVVNIVEVPITHHCHSHTLLQVLNALICALACARWCELLRIEIMYQIMHVHRG